MDLTTAPGINTWAGLKLERIDREYIAGTINYGEYLAKKERVLSYRQTLMTRLDVTNR